MSRNPDQGEKVNGFICASGHLFWIEWIWPSPPLICPICGNRDFNTTGTGIIVKD